MGLSALDDVLNEVVRVVTALKLQLAKQFIPVVKRKLPKKEETVDPATQITVCADERVDDVKWFEMATAAHPTGAVRVKYKVLVVIMSPNNDDQATNLPVYTQWRAAIRALFQQLQGQLNLIEIDPAYGYIWDANVVNGEPFLDRQAISENYDYQTVGVEISTVEPG